MEYLPLDETIEWLFKNTFGDVYYHPEDVIVDEWGKEWVNADVISVQVLNSNAMKLEIGTKKFETFAE